jgi:uncharacterized protein
MSDRDATSDRSGEDARMDTIIEGLSYSSRSPVLHWPDEAGLEWEDVVFPSTDGTPLEAWFIPAAGSDRLVVCAHPLGFSRAGFPSHLEPWKSAFGPGNDYELDFIPDYGILHRAGFNVLAYDFRNFGHSGDANGRLQSNNRFEARDVIGSLRYVRSRSDLSKMSVGLFSRCMGANATFRAISTDPDAFADVRCLVAPLLLSASVGLERMLEGAGLGHRLAEVAERQRRITGTPPNELSPVEWAAAVTMPTLTYGVRDDAITRPSDLEAIYAAIAAEEKAMFWIESSIRWDGYTWFQRHPQVVLDWLDCHLR